MENYLLTAFLENLLERFSASGFIVSGIITLLAIVLVIVLALIPPVLIISLVVFVYRRITRNSAERSEKRHKNWIEKHKEKEAREAKELFEEAKRNFRYYLPKNLPECAKKIDIIKGYETYNSEEAEEFLEEAERMLDEEMAKGTITKIEKIAVLNYSDGEMSDRRIQAERLHSEGDTRKALEWFLVEAERGNAVCMHYCGLIYEGKEGSGIPVNKDKAFYWHKKAAESEKMLYKKYMGKVYSEGKICRKDLLAAANYYAEAGEKGDAISYHKAAMCCHEYSETYMKEHGIEYGDQVDADCPALIYENEAGKYQELAVKNGYTFKDNISEQLNETLDDLKKVIKEQENKEEPKPKDRFAAAKNSFIDNLPDNLPQCARAIEEIRELESNGSSEAEKFLDEAAGMLDEQIEKENIKLNEGKAVFGYESERFETAMDLYEAGREKEALEWLLIDAEKGEHGSQFACALIYEGYDSNGEKTNKPHVDYKKAMYWYEKAAESGYADYMNQLAVNYVNGEICERNLLKAAGWFRKAGETGDAEAYYEAALCYRLYAREYMEEHGLKVGDKVSGDCPAYKYSIWANNLE